MLCVKMLKGKGRPLQSESERAEILASMECVDYVLIFDTPTVDGILKELKPDIHAKGTDYTEESVPERQTVRTYGGRVAIAGDPKDHSTRDLIQTSCPNSIHERFSQNTDYSSQFSGRHPACVAGIREFESILSRSTNRLAGERRNQNFFYLRSAGSMRFMFWTRALVEVSA